MKRSPFLLLLLFACENDTVLYQQPYQGYEEGDVTVIGGGEDDARVATGNDGECLQVEDTCVPVDREGKYCKESDGPVDVIVVNGEVVEVVCYEDSTGDGPDQVVAENGDVTVPQNENGAVVTFDDSTNGIPIEGNVTIDGNNVTLYGNGPDATIIDGNLIITGNNARVRGVRVTGNVTLDLNTAAFVLSVVEGNLVIRSNNCLAAENDVFGNLVNDGQNTILVGNDVAGNFEGTGSNATCQDNYSFADQNEDGIVAAAERTEAITCR